MDEPVNSGGDFAFRTGGARAGGARNLGDQFARAILHYFSGTIKDLSTVIGGGLTPTVHRRPCGHHGVPKILA